MSRIAPEFWARPFAHRGLHNGKQPENSLAAIVAAADAGYGVEFDVQLSGDGEAVVFHDYTLERLTQNNGRVDAVPAEKLGRLKLFDTAETIPTLGQVLDAIGDRAPILLEIKDQSGSFGETDGVLEARVVDVLRRAKSSNCAVMSFNPHAVARVRKALPTIACGIVSYDFEHPHDAHVSAAYRRELAGLAHFDDVDADFVSYGATSLPAPATEALRARGVPVFCWTVRTAAQAQAALGYSDQITFEGYKPA